MTAADHLRASLAALSPLMRTDWRARRTSVDYQDGHAWPPVVEAYNSADDAPLMAHIALTASPHVVTALADLLDAIERHRLDEGTIFTVHEARDALEAAILQGRTTP
jgi:hypothetical protein